MIDESMESNNTDVLLEGHITGLKGLDINYSGEILSDDEDLDDLVFASSSPRGASPPERPAYPGDGEHATQTMVKREVIGTEDIITGTPTPSSKSGTSSVTPVGSVSGYTVTDQLYQTETTLHQTEMTRHTDSQQGDDGLNLSSGFASQTGGNSGSLLMSEGYSMEQQFSVSQSYAVQPAQSAQSVQSVQSVQSAQSAQSGFTSTPYTQTFTQTQEFESVLGTRPKHMSMADEFEVHRQEQQPNDTHNKYETMSLASSSSYVDDSRFDETLHHSLHNEITDIPAALTPQSGSTNSFDLPNDNTITEKTITEQIAEKTNLAGEIDQSLVSWQMATESVSQRTAEGSVSDTITDSDMTVIVSKKPFSSEPLELSHPAAPLSSEPLELSSPAAPLVPKLDLSEDSADRTLAESYQAEEMMSSRSVSLDLSNVTASDRVTPSGECAGDGKTSIMSLSPVPDLPEETTQSKITETKAAESKTWPSTAGQSQLPAAQSTPKVTRKAPSEPAQRAEVKEVETNADPEPEDTTEVLKPPTEASAMIRNLKEKLRAKSTSEGDNVKPSSLSPKPVRAMRTQSAAKSPTPAGLNSPLSPSGGRAPNTPIPKSDSSPSLKQLSHQLAMEAIQQRASIRGTSEKSSVPTLPIGSVRPSERLASWREKEEKTVATRETRKSESVTLKSPAAAPTAAAPPTAAEIGILSPQPKRRQSEVSMSLMEC